MPQKTAAVFLLVGLALLSAAQAQDAAEQISCRVHVVNNTGSPDNNLQGHVRSSLKVLAAADIQDVSVILQVQHPDVAALEATLTAAGSSKNSSSVTLKAPAAGVTAGANMIQTIFSDYAPNTLPLTAADAPYSSVYRPAQPLSSLVAGDSTAAGAGGSQGVWNLTVTDTDKTSRRPLKLTGWELWLCGASNGPLFASVEQNTTASDGSEVIPEVSIVKKRVAVPSKADVAAVIKTTLRTAQAEDDPVAEVIDQVNSFLAEKLASLFDAVEPVMSKASPQLATLLNSSVVSSIASLDKLPAAMGYLRKGDHWELPTSEESIKEFLDTLVHCHNDLFWCWQQTGLEGSFAQDFVASWEARAKPVASAWAATQDQWLQSLIKFEEENPALARWGDVLFTSAIGTMYRAAQLDAVATVAETWADTAIRLALYLSPLRFAVNPRAFIVQTLSVAEIPVQTLFETFQVINALTDEENNNDVEAITVFTQGLVDAMQQTVSVLTSGLQARAEAMQQSMVASAGGLANSAANIGKRLGETLNMIDPRLGAIYNNSTEGVNEMLRGIAGAQQDAVERYFRATNLRMGLAGTLDETFTLAGKVVMQLAENAAIAMKSAQKALDDMLPGPDMQDVIVGLRSTIEKALDDAREALEKIVPTPELAEMEDLMRATVRASLDMLDDAATTLNDGPGAQAIQAQLGRMATNLMAASQGVNGVMQQINDGFPGPMLNSTLDGIRQQSARTVTNVERMFKNLVKQYPNLNPETFATELGSTLGGLTTTVMDLSGAFGDLAGVQAARELSQALPGAVQPVVESVRTAANDLPALLSRTPGRNNEEALTRLQGSIGDALETFAGQVRSIADALPSEPPVNAITSRLSERSAELASESNELHKAVIDMLNSPSKVVEAGLKDYNYRLQRLLDDLKGQADQAAKLGEMLAQGPLADIAKGLSTIMEPVTRGLEAVTSRVAPEASDMVSSALTPRVDALSATVKEISSTAVAATAAANEGGLQVMAGLLDRLVSQMVQGQLQVAGLLSAAGQVGQSLTVRTPNLEGRLGELDVALSNVAKGVASNLQTSLASLAPPEVVEGLVTPLAARLDSALGGLLEGLDRTAESTLPALLERAAGVVGDLTAGASAVLGLPTPPGRAGRHLLADTAPLASLPAGFDAAAFRGTIATALQGAASEFANAAVAAISGRPGASIALEALQQYIGSVSGVAGKFDKFLGLIPKGPVLSVLFDGVGGKKVIQSLLDLATGLRSAEPGQQGPIMQEIASVLSSLGSQGSAVDGQTAVQAAMQAATKQLLPNAQDLLAGFRSQVAAAVGSGN